MSFELGVVIFSISQESAKTVLRSNEENEGWHYKTFPQ